MKVDLDMLFIAIGSNEHGFDYTGFLHRRTGEILFVYEEERAVAGFMGEEHVADAVFDRATVEAAPEDWVEIPKYDWREWGRHQEEEFLREFFQEAGLDVEIC